MYPTFPRFIQPEQMSYFMEKEIKLEYYEWLVAVDCISRK